MRVGVVCEGPTDFVAIKHFFHHCLARNQIEADFIPIQPQMDNTSPEGGWGNVLLWLSKNPPPVRIANLFGGGLFGGGLAIEPLSCLLIQLDTDVLDDVSFRNFVSSQYNYSVVSHSTTHDRADEVRKILRTAWREDAMTVADNDRHIATPAVESTEAWCLAAFFAQPQNCELIQGQSLIDQFMSALEVTEGRQPNLPYSQIDKNVRRRQRFCLKHASNSHRISAGCSQFGHVLQQLQSLA